MRLIDVSVLKEWIENWFTKNRFYHPYAKNNNIPITELYDILEQMPPAQPEQHWIPCNERLPAYGEDVLISIDGYCNVGHVVPVNEEERYNWYFSGWYHSPNDVDAWMPLPEPWRGEEHESV